MKILAGSVCVSVAVVAAVVAFTMGPAAAQDCSAFDPGEPGDKMPVILIHGFNGDRSSMQPTRDALVGAGLDVHIVDFDYPCAKTEWVENPNIGLRLQNAIKDLADRSMEAGGPGKVTVIGHSMGGLATRQALAGGDLDDRIAFVATYGTPHNGSTIAKELDADTFDAKVVKYTLQKFRGVPLDSNAGQALQAFSEQINRLQPFSRTFPVMSIAGDYLVTERLGNWVRSERSFGDIVVDKVSALQQAVAGDGLGGQAVTTCEIAMPVIRGDNRWDDIRNAIFDHSYSNRTDLESCYHGNLMRDPYLQLATVDQIRTVIERTEPRRPPAPLPVPTTAPATPTDPGPEPAAEAEPTVEDFCTTLRQEKERIVALQRDVLQNSDTDGFTRAWLAAEAGLQELEPYFTTLAAASPPDVRPSTERFLKWIRDTAALSGEALSGSLSAIGALAQLELYALRNCGELV